MTRRADMAGAPGRPTALHTSTLAAVTLAVLAILLVRAHYEPYLDRGYLVWNLFLAWIPYVCARVVWRAARAGSPLVLLLPLLALWLAFLPNAPYLVTDVVHLHHPHDLRLLIEVGLFGTVALAGVLLGVASMQPIHRLVAERYGRLASAAFPPVIAIAVAFGVYLGRVQRWNSWSFVEQPRKLAHAAWSVAGHPIEHPRAIGGIVLFWIAFLVVYSALTSERSPLRTPQRQT